MNRLQLDDIHSKSVHPSENNSHSNDGHKKSVSKIKMVKKNYQVNLELDTVKYDDVEVQKPTENLSSKKSIKKSFFQSIIHSLVMKDSSVSRESTSEVSTDDNEGVVTFFDKSETTDSNTQSTTDDKVSVKFESESTSDEDDKNYTSSGSSLNSDDSDTSAEEESLPVKQSDLGVDMENIDLNN